MRTFEEWFDMMQDIGEHCGTSLGQWHMELMEAAWDASREELKAENESLRKDAELGRIALKYFDRMDDPADCDPLEKSVAEFLAAICAAISSPENH